MTARLRMGMVGGGPGSLAGGLHRRAAALDGEIDLVAGAVGSTPERALAAGRALGLPRVYETWQQMLDAELRLPADERIDFVTVCTPNHLHHPIAKAFVSAGVAVACDKPMTVSLAQAQDLAETVRRAGVPFLLTHNYSGYPMVRQARALVRGGTLGTITKVVVEYSQGWLSAPIERDGHAAARSRTDPAVSGPSGCLIDIGIHAQQLLHYVTGLEIVSVCADLGRHHGRPLDDDASVLLRLSGEVRGLLFASQIGTGEENNLNLRVYGSEGSLAWRQMEPDDLWLRPRAAAMQVQRRGGEYLCAAARRACRIPAGHPEGFLEGFANLYHDFAQVLRARRKGEAPDPLALDVPGVADGVRTLAFVEAALASDAGAQKWQALPGWTT